MSLDRERDRRTKRIIKSAGFFFPHISLNFILIMVKRLIQVN